MLQQDYQKQTLSRSTVFLWHKRFKEGCDDIEDDPRGGSPSISRNEIFFDVRSVVLHEFLPQGQTVNQHVYQEILQRLFRSDQKGKKGEICGKATHGCFITIMRPHTLH